MSKHLISDRMGASYTCDAEDPITESYTILHGDDDTNEQHVCVAKHLSSTFRHCTVFFLVVLIIFFLFLLILTVYASIRGWKQTARCPTKCIVGNLSTASNNSKQVSFYYRICSCPGLTSDALAELFTFASESPSLFNTTIVLYFDRNPQTQSCDYRLSMNDFTGNWPSFDPWTPLDTFWWQLSLSIIGLTLLVGTACVWLWIGVCQMRRQNQTRTTKKNTNNAVMTLIISNGNSRA